jgi:hypothetical protein
MVPVFGATVACSIAVFGMNARSPILDRAVSLLLVAQWSRHDEIIVATAWKSTRIMRAAQRSA